MQQEQHGFTLIELIVVIVILGILAATALPKFIDLQDDARLAAVKGVAAAATSGYAINYGARKANSANGVAVNGTQAAICTVANLGAVMTGGMPSGYTVAAGATNMDCSVAANDGNVGTCTVADAVDATQTAVATYICVN